MARYGATLTVKPGQITGTVNNLAWYLDADSFPVAAVDGGASSILNGGGNARFYTDSTTATRLPVELVTFVTGVTPNIHARGLSSSLAVGGTIYIEADTVETSQPAFDAAFGRNAVWSPQNTVIAAHLESSGESSTGSNSLTTLVGTPSYVAGEIGNALDTSSGHIGTLSLPALGNSNVRITTLVKPFDITSNGYICGGGNGNFNGVIVGYQDNSFNIYNGAYPTGTASDTEIAATVDQWQRITFTSDGTTLKGFKNGVEVFSVLAALKITASDYYVGGYKGGVGGRPNANIDEFIYSNEYITAEKEEVEYNNQSNPSAFWSVGAWEDQDAAGELNIVGSTPSYSYTVPTATVDLTGELNIVGSTPSYSYAVPTATVDLTGELNIVASTPSYSYTVPTASVDLTGELNIVASTPSYSYTVPTASVDLTGDLVIVATTPTYSYNAVNAVVAFSGTITFSGDVILNSLQFSGHDIKAPVATFASISGDITFNKY